MRSSFIGTIFAALALPRGLLAAPPLAENFGTEDQGLVVRQEATATQQELDSFKYMVQFAAAAYCNNRQSQVGSKVTCANDACVQVERNDVINFAHVDTDINANMDGAVYVDRTNRMIVLAFMGSKSPTSYLLELDFTVASIPDLCQECKVSYGLNMVWVQTQKSIVNAINSARQQFPGFRIVAAGHSGGGGLVSIATSYLRAKYGIAMDLYTFGSPRVGNEVWAQFVTDQAPAMGNNYRVTHHNDPIVAIPPAWIDHMSHISPEYWLRRKEASTPDYPLSELVICRGVRTKDCRASKGTTLSTKAHSYYFQRVSGCYNK
ncbi:hypothetical protein MAPG_01538 [Magnaporthiopsis poae ATCC 64411]|uniref:Fungal lipase-type domain-containing protein n=1 Tax=Magnaporthiopsis poae (strain ATCC 64411 / 73-15) TaxID=644358 RepID=A0A0C4DNY9_MAGP6|nr:hypothetical protein MAPG_01538 [Magnaporthiopsis poae ATCC 64411]